MAELPRVGLREKGVKVGEKLCVGEVPGPGADVSHDIQLAREVIVPGHVSMVALM